jgi:hypothetical protein
MNSNISKHLLAAAAFAITGSVCAQQPEQPVKVNIDGLPPHVSNQVKEKASQGPTELRRFVNRTRMIHELNYNSLVQEDSPTAIAKKDETKMAARPAEPSK